jgi:hypothetical protein
MELIGTGKQRAGKTSQIVVGTTPLTFASWEVTLTTDDLDTDNFESYNATAGQSYGEGIMGFLSCDLKFGGDWDAGTDPLGSPPGLYPRDDLANLNFYTSRIDGIYWSFPYARLRSATNGAQVKGKVTFSCSGKNQGPFTFPTGSV